MVLGMGLSDAEFRITVLAAFPLPFPCTKFASFFPGVLGGARRKIVLGHVLVPFLGFHQASSETALLGPGLRPKRGVSLGLKLSGPTIAPQNPAARL